MDADLLALGADPLVVQVVEAARRALPPASGAADGERAVGADGEAARVDCACLWGAVELELAVGDDGAGAAVAVAEDALVEVADEGAIGGLWDVRMGMRWCWAKEGGMRCSRLTSAAVSRFWLPCGSFSVPMVKLPFELGSHPDGG